jgi:hypothetical protein
MSVANMLLLMLATLLFSAPSAHAAVVGRLVMVSGQVDLLKQGKLPAVPAKVQDGVEPGDIIRTKSQAKAQIKFVDDTTVTLAPESRIAVADYQYDEARRERHAVLRYYKGLVHTVVNKLLQTQEPDFIIETHTAVFGVRGTEKYTLLMPAYVTGYLVAGLLEVRSSDPKIPAVLLMKAMEFTQIPLGQQPMLPQPLTPAMLQTLQGMMGTGVTGNKLLGGGLGAAAASRGANLPEQLPVSPVQTMLQSQPIITPQAPPPTMKQELAPPPVQPHQPGGAGTGKIVSP